MQEAGGWARSYELVHLASAPGPGALSDTRWRSGLCWCECWLPS
eukprot:COSAG01_NODE_21958_length_877_cov_12.713368_1_plen_43_part_10